MKLMVNHQTHYAYSDQVSNSIQYIKMSPFNSLHQKVHYWDISVPGEREIKHDAFHNIWLTSHQRRPYKAMTIMAQGVVELNERNQQGVVDHLNPYIFLQPTDLTQCSEEMKSFVELHVSRLSRSHLIHLAEVLLQYIPYQPAQTSVTTSAIEAFNHRQGVCQDHSHIFIAMCKHLGLPARYASGYLYVPEISHLASHAWSEVYIDDAWYCFDVSNQLFTPSAHIYVAVGRDYWDVAPVRGVRKRGGQEFMNSSVQVLEVR